MLFYLFDAYQAAKDRLAQIPSDVRTEARRMGVSISYTVPEFGTDVVIEYPNGRRERRLADGSVVEIPPRRRTQTDIC